MNIEYIFNEISYVYNKRRKKYYLKKEFKKLLKIMKSKKISDLEKGLILAPMLMQIKLISWQPVHNKNKFKSGGIVV